MSAPLPPYSPEANQWTFSYRGGSTVHEDLPLVLVPEVNGASLSDDYYADEISARDMFRLWVDYTHRTHERQRQEAEWRYDDDDDPCLSDLGDDSVSITWYVSSPAQRGLFEFADQCPVFGRGGVYWSRNSASFSTYWSTPLHAVTGDPINWERVPLATGQWRRPRDDENFHTETPKGAYIFEATGWKPCPFQATVSLTDLAQRAGMQGRLVGGLR